MMRRPALALAVLALGLTGCTTTTIDYHTMSAAELAAKPEYMPSFNTPPPNGTLIGQMEATVCQRLPGDPPSTARLAELELKRQAATRGARGLVDLRTRETKTPSGECITSALAYATAYDFPIGQ